MTSRDRHVGDVDLFVVF